MKDCAMEPRFMVEKISPRAIMIIHQIVTNVLGK